MKNLITALLLLMLTLIFTGCFTMTRLPLSGALYVGVKSGLTATGLSKAPKSGEACAMSILGLVAVGDASIETAKTNGNITKISMVDEKNTSFLLGLYSQYCTVVYGK